MIMNEKLDSLEEFLDQNKNTDASTQNLSPPPPSNTLAEQMLLGAILINNDVLYQISEFLLHEHFYDPINRKIYEAVLLLTDKGLSANIVSLRNMLHADEQFQKLEKENYLNKLTTLATTVISGYEYGRIIYDLALKRNLISIGHNIVKDAYGSGLDYTAVEQIECAENKLFNLASYGVNERSFISLKSSIDQSLESINAAIKHKDGIIGIPTGFIDLDNILAGFHNSDLIILAGRPGMGKTTLALNLAAHAAQSLLARYKSKEEKELQSVGVFSLEMPSEQLSTKLLSMHASINTSILRSGKIREEEYNNLRVCGEQLSELPLFIDDTPALSIAAIRTRARRLKRKHNLGILLIDYLQLAHGAKHLQNRVLEIGEITQGLKAIAKELNIPVLAMSQLSRAVEQRNDRRPLLADLRESGSIEQDADIVLFIYREEYYLKQQKPQEGSDNYEKWKSNMEKVHNTAEVLIAKHRNGPTGAISLYYDSNYSKFSNAVRGPIAR